jgi:branched-chain amino acid transport system substrate-binding protein
LLVSCAPVNNISKVKDNQTQKNLKDDVSKEEFINKENPTLFKKQLNLDFDISVKNNITIIFSKNDNPNIVRQFINVVELAVYEKKLDNISFDIMIYDNSDHLIDFLNESNLSGKIFIGPLGTVDTSLVEKYCDEGVIFFSFSSNKNLANKCLYLVNFFPENDMRTIFAHFPDNSKIALLYPENEYGFGINKTIDIIADQSNSVIINRASYNENLTNAPQAIKELGKYELRKYELNRQKKILASKNDKESKKRLIRLEKFQTTKDFDFTHVIIADYGLRLLQVAPLLPYYDIDPNIVRFVGTGAWDDEVFYDEPSLNRSIYPGVEFNKRKQLVEDYRDLYGEKLLRTSTLPYDLVGLLAFVINNKYTLSSFYTLLNQTNIKFSGVDGDFYFLNNAIERDLNILQIVEGGAVLILK